MKRKRKGKRKKRKRKQPAQVTYADVGGYSNFTYVLATLQCWNGTSWVWCGETTNGPNRYYTLRALAGLTYRYYVSTEVNTPTYFPGLGWYNCAQTWADESPYVTAAPGGVYTNLNTTLRPVGQARC